jgi:hypothetical protein
VGEHSGLRLTALNIEGRQSLIERDGLANTEHQFSGTFGKPTTPNRLFFTICHNNRIFAPGRFGKSNPIE